MSNYWSNTYSSGGDARYKTTSDDIVSPTTFITYEANSSFLNSEGSIGFGDGEGWKTSCIANRRAFIANVKRKERSGGGANKKFYGDRIYYSPPNRFDTFPSLNFLDIGINDGDEIINLSNFGDRLLAFKRNTLYIINISQANDTAWFLEEQYLGYGVMNTYSVFQSQIGIVWANKNGAFLFDGNTINDLTKDKIDVTTWASDNMGNSIVGYYPKGNLIYFVAPSRSDTYKEIDLEYVFDIKTKSWAKSSNTGNTKRMLWQRTYGGYPIQVSAPVVNYTNFQIDHYGQLIMGYNYIGNYPDVIATPIEEDEYEEKDTGNVTL
jgi:hypothetical protein